MLWRMRKFFIGTEEHFQPFQSLLTWRPNDVFQRHNIRLISHHHQLKSSIFAPTPPYWIKNPVQTKNLLSIHLWNSSSFFDPIKESRIHFYAKPTSCIYMYVLWKILLSFINEKKNTRFQTFHWFSRISFYFHANRLDRELSGGGGC